MSKLIIQLWKKINEPRVISAVHAVTYLVLLTVGLYSLINPPRSVEGAVGEFAMNLLAGVLAVGGAIGVPTALSGIWWLERTATALVILSSAIYLMIVLALQFTSTEGTNRFLQAGYVFAVLALHITRWYRVRQRPYDPERIAPGARD